MNRFYSRLLILGCPLFVSISFLGTSFAQEGKGSHGTLERLDQLIRQVENAEREQAELLKGQDEIIAEIRKLKMWSAKQ